MKERVLTIFISLLLGVGLLLLLPPGVSERCAGLVRLVTQPVQSWTDCGARMAWAAMGGNSMNSSSAEGTGNGEELQSLQTALSQVRLEYAAAQARETQLRRELALNGDLLRDEEQALTVCLARVVKRDPLASYYDSLVIARGRNDGLKPGQFVVSPMRGNEEPKLVGIVAEVSATTAFVCLISNADCAIPCQIPARNVTGLLAGVAHGGTDGPQILLPVESLLISHPEGTSYDNLQAGDVVYTSAQGDNPQAVENILIGRVASVGQGDDGLPQVLLQPATPLSQLTHVLVVLKANQRRR